MLDSEGNVCLLRKALYGLKQSPRVWFERFHSTMIQFGYKQTQVDHTLFAKHNGDNVTTLIVYVDDIVVTGNDGTKVTRLKDYLAKEYEIRDLSSL